MNKKTLKIIGKVILIAAVIVGVVWLNRLAIGSEAVRDFAAGAGYLGIFLASIASGFNVIIPIPIIGFYPFFIESGFSSIPLIIVISAGMLLGDLLGYLIGHTGRDMAAAKKGNGKIVKRMEVLRDKHPMAPILFLLFYASFVPLPNELIVIPMAFMGYRLPYMLGALFIGNLIFNSLAAFGFLQVV